MKKIKLTPIQEKKLQEASQATSNLRNQVIIAQAQLNSAANHQQSILEMIYESHGIDPKDIAPNTRANIKDGYLTIGEANASDRIKKDLKKTIKQSSNGKAKSNR